MWGVIRTPLVSLCSRTSEYSAQSIGVIGSYVNVVKMFCRFSKQSHSTARNTESHSKWQVQWKLRIWEACEQRCARHHAVCWWPRWQDGYMQCELTIACYIMSCLLFTADKLCSDRPPWNLIESDSTICCMCTTVSSWNEHLRLKTCRVEYYFMNK